MTKNLSVTNKQGDKVRRERVRKGKFLIKVIEYKLWQAFTVRTKRGFLGL
jgi:hypothetical protein